MCQLVSNPLLFAAGVGNSIFLFTIFSKLHVIYHCAMVLIGSDPGGGYNLCWFCAGAEEDRSKIGGGALVPVEAAIADDIVGGGPGGVRRP